MKKNLTRLSRVKQVNPRNHLHFDCPRCGEPSVWEGNEFRPFCSERCKLIDLGAWANDIKRYPQSEEK
jgi:endogenous inhibitor of DNA gyrase (YacG/DUF329 family)